MKTIRLTAAQALVRFMIAQKTTVDGEKLPFFPAIWAIFGHGNVAGLGEALFAHKDQLPTLRAHNEQAMAHAAIAFAKARFAQQVMACTTSIGPGALNMVTSAALAHVNRLPVLLIPGDVFASRLPDPVLQQVEAFQDATISANDCFRPVSRFYDRITRPEQLLASLPQMMRIFTEPAERGPVTLAFCQDVQAQSFDYPKSLFEERVWRIRRPIPDADELEQAINLLKTARKPLIIAGGGVLYAQASQDLQSFAEKYHIPVAVTQAGKSVLPDQHPLMMGSIGVTGTSSANMLAEEADLIFAIGTRLQDFTTGSWSLFRNPKSKILSLNTTPFDGVKHFSTPLIGDTKMGLGLLLKQIKRWNTPQKWQDRAHEARQSWLKLANEALAPQKNFNRLPSDAEVIGAVLRSMGEKATVVCAAGGLPGELHKLWSAREPGSYHMEYGFSTMGYEIAGALGVKLAQAERDVVVMVGDGSYLMMNSEIATSLLLGLKITIIVLDNKGYGCINRLQRATGSESFNNLLVDTMHKTLPEIDFALHAQALGAKSRLVTQFSELENAVAWAKAEKQTAVVVIKTDALATTEAGGSWWDVAVPEVSARPDVQKARVKYDQALRHRAILG